MEFVEHADIKSGKGRVILLYGDTGNGKTVGAIGTTQTPTLVISGERRNFALPLEFVMTSPEMKPRTRPDLVLRLAKPDAGIEDLIRFLCTPTNFRAEPTKEAPNPPNFFKTVVLDGFSHFLGVTTMREVADHSFSKLSKVEQLKNSLTATAKLDWDGWAAVADQGLRVFDALTVLSDRGHVVVVTCLGVDRPKYDRALAYGPLLPGKLLPQYVPGSCDVIGRVSARRTAAGALVWPPQVDMVSPENDFTAKMTGKIVGGPCQELNISKMLGLEEPAP